MTRRRGKPSRPGGLWLLVPAACCAGPPLVAGLATAAALAWARLGLVPGIALAAAMLLVSALAQIPAARAGAAPS